MRLCVTWQHPNTIYFRHGWFLSLLCFKWFLEHSQLNYLSSTWISHTFIVACYVTVSEYHTIHFSVRVIFLMPSFVFSIWFLQYLDPHSVILHVTSACFVTPTHFCSVFCKSDILQHANYIFLMVFRILVFYLCVTLRYNYWPYYSVCVKATFFLHVAAAASQSDNLRWNINIVLTSERSGNRKNSILI